MQASMQKEHWKNVYVCPAIGLQLRLICRSCTPSQVVDTANPPSKQQDSELLKFTGPTDSVFLNAPEYLELDVGTGKFPGIVLNSQISSIPCMPCAL